MASRRSNARRNFDQTAQAALARLLPQATDAEIQAIKEELRGSRGHAGTGGAGATGPAGAPGAVADKGCRIYHNTTQIVPTSSGTALTFNSERWDTDSMHNPAVNPTRITFNTAGKYHISVSFGMDANATGWRTAYFILNNVTIIAIHSHPGTSEDENNISLSTIYTFAVADYVEAFLYQDSGGNRTITADPNRSPEFMAQLLAAT